MTYKRSVFPEGGYDQFNELYDATAQDFPNLDILSSLQRLTNPTTDQTQQLSNLLTQYNNFIINAEKINHYQDAMSNTQKFFVDSVGNYLNDKGNYSNTTPYKIYNIVHDVNGDVYIALQDNTGALLSDSINWRRISVKGDKGDKGDSIKGDTGIGLAFIGSYDPSATYTINQGVEYNGSLYGCISSIPITGVSPSDTSNWSMAVSKGSSTFLTVLRNFVVVSTNVSSIAIGITGFNKNNDQIFVYKDNEYVEQTQEYSLSSDGLSIGKVVSTWDGSITPVIFNFVVFKNVVQGATLSDGSLIQIQSITLDKLNIDIQNKINRIGVAVLQTTAQDLSGAVNENTNNLIALTTVVSTKQTSGTTNPTGGVNGDIYFQYI